VASRLKDHPENSDEGQQAKADAVAADSATADEVRQRVDVETEQGFRGVEVDQTPNEAYTVQGVTSGQATPETDADAAAKAREGQKAAEQRAAGVGER
jgi:hypothetical protein